jgi:hypothetical protein
VTPTVVDPLTDTALPTEPDMPVPTLDTGSFDKSLGKNGNPKPAAPPIPDKPPFGNEVPPPVPVPANPPASGAAKVPPQAPAPRERSTLRQRPRHLRLRRQPNRRRPRSSPFVWCLRSWPWHPPSRWSRL